MNRKIVDRHKGNYRVHRFRCWDHLLCLCFAQLTFRESLRVLTSTLNALEFQRLYDLHQAGGHLNSYYLKNHSLNLTPLSRNQLGLFDF